MGLDSGADLADGATVLVGLGAGGGGATQQVAVEVLQLAVGHQKVGVLLHRDLEGPGSLAVALEPFQGNAQVVVRPGELVA